MTKLTGKDLLAGALFAAMGIFFLYQARNYPLGALNRAGPGFFVTVICVLLIVVGAALVVRGVLKPGGRFEPMRLRPVFFIVASVVFFAATLRGFGLVPAILGTVVLGSLGAPTRRWHVVAGVALFLCVFCSLVFIWMLSMPIQYFAIPRGLLP